MTRRDPSILFLMAPARRLQFNLSAMYPLPRLGIGLMASHLRRHGFRRVATRDLIAEREWIPELLARFRREGAPDLIGISTTVLSLREAFEIARAVKAEHPGTRVVVGGPGVGFEARPLLAYGEAVDFFVRGEGEGPMLELVRAIADERDDLSGVPALVWRRPDGTPCENPPGPFRDLDDGLEVDWEGQPMGKYRLHPPMGIYPPGTMLETARGCSYPCDFCCLSMPVRTRSPAGVEADVRHLVTRFGVREVHFVDPTFTLRRERALEICERLRALPVHWSCKTRVDRTDDVLLAAMSESGCYLVAFGVESGDDGVLGAIHKRTEAERASEAFRLCRQYGIRTTAYLMVGNPGEDDAAVDRTIAFVRRLEPDYVLYDILQADPINPLTQRRIAEGHITAADLERYYMSDEPSALDLQTIAGHPMEVARGWLKRASSDFYVRPRYFWERVRDLRTLQDAANLGAGGFMFFRDLLGRGRLWGLGE